MAVLFAWNQRPKDHISYESLQLATELPDTELRKTLFVSDFGMSVMHEEMRITDFLLVTLK